MGWGHDRRGRVKRPELPRLVRHSERARGVTRIWFRGQRSLTEQGHTHIHTGNSRPVRHQPLAPRIVRFAPDCRVSRRPKRSTAEGSAYGQRGLAQMRPVIVRQSGLTLMHESPLRECDESRGTRYSERQSGSQNEVGCAGAHVADVCRRRRGGRTRRGFAQDESQGIALSKPAN